VFHIAGNSGGKNMIDIKSEILAASKILRIKTSELSQVDKKKLLLGISNKYTGVKNRDWLWKYVKDVVSIANKDAWQWVENFIGDSKTIMFFNQSDDKSAFIFMNGHDVVKILGETFGFEFYLTNENTDYLLCFDHHDVLSAAGTAGEWLKSYIVTNN
jgi:hypothetical protein